MLTPRVVFRHTVESFIRDVLQRRELLTPDFVAALAGKGIDVNKPRDLPRERWWALLELTAERIAPGRTRAENMELIGREMVRAFADGLVGRGLFMLLRIMGPRRAMLRTAENFRAADNFSSASVREVGKHHLELVYTPVAGMPELVLGILAESMTLIGVKNPRVVFELTPSSDGATYSLQWDP